MERSKGGKSFFRRDAGWISSRLRSCSLQYAICFADELDFVCLLRTSRDVEEGQDYLDDKGILIFSLQVYLDQVQSPLLRKEIR